MPQSNMPSNNAATVSADQPLGLTVHNMPQIAQSSDTAARTKFGRWQLMALLLICASPVIASYFTYYVVRPEGRRNTGELIDPQLPTPAILAKTMDAQMFNLQALKGQWVLVSVSGGACDQVCQKHLYLQRQIRESLGKEKDRLDWVWLVNDDVPVAEALRPALKDATVLRVPAAQLATWLQPAQGSALSDHLYVLDPMGNWMMRFASGMNAETAAKAKKDIDRMMRATNSWDNAGR